MFIGRRNFHQKFETFILNWSRENHVSPKMFQIDFCNYRVASVIKLSRLISEKNKQNYSKDHHVYKTSSEAFEQLI